MKNKDTLRVAYAYENGIGNFEQAESFYQQAVEESIPNANYFLACFYQSQGHKSRKVETYFRAAIENGNAEAEFAMGTLYLGKKKFEKAKSSFKNAMALGNFDAKLMLVFMDLSITKDDYSAETALIQLLNEGDLLKPDFDYSAERVKLLGLSFIFLLSKEHYEFLYHFFNTKQAEALQYKDRFKPIYYALLHFLKEVHPNEYLRMGLELKETVEEIVAQVEEARYSLRS